MFSLNASYLASVSALTRVVAILYPNQSCTKTYANKTNCANIFKNISGQNNFAGFISIFSFNYLTRNCSNLFFGNNAILIHVELGHVIAITRFIRQQTPSTGCSTAHQQRFTKYWNKYCLYFMIFGGFYGWL